MVWVINYHRFVKEDFQELGHSQAKKIRNVIQERIKFGEPDKIGKLLHGKLAGYRRLRAGDMRIVYRVDKGKIEILIIAVGMRRDDEVYEKAGKRAG
jgi:mRNA interferase RelE/StbE